MRLQPTFSIAGFCGSRQVAVDTRPNQWFRCRVCGEGSFPLRYQKYSNTTWITVYYEVTTDDKLINKQGSQVCFLCFAKNAVWDSVYSHAFPCANCLAYGTFARGPGFKKYCSPDCESLPENHYHDCGNHEDSVSAEYMYPDDFELGMHEFRQLIYSLVHKWDPIKQRLQLLWLFKQTDWPFHGLDRNIVQHMCRIGFPLPTEK